MDERFNITIGSRLYVVPLRMRQGLIRYVERGITPGGFLLAVLENNLMEATKRADDENLLNLPAFVNFLYNHAPSICWGSPEKVSRWISLGGLGRFDEKGDHDASSHS